MPFSSQRAHTSLPPFALQIAVLEAGAVRIVTVTVGRLVIVAVVLTMVYLVFVFVGVGCEQEISIHESRRMSFR
jgi:hypothetical protein